MTPFCPASLGMCSQLNLREVQLGQGSKAASLGLGSLVSQCHPCVRATLLCVCVCVCSEQHHLGGESRGLPRVAHWRRRSCKFWTGNSLAHSLYTLLLCLLV